VYVIDATFIYYAMHLNEMLHTFEKKGVDRIEISSYKVLKILLIADDQVKISDFSVDKLQ
jgi:hypothetical protein